ncbi:MAG TPA: M20/M25/M40 family metallo-hydrolase [Candidatus Dormibacteraeota bacterium]|nr:M20/M25/M40 family metallo-hydrolase [Candidatus Dormibacteraeota bacterium]
MSERAIELARAGRAQAERDFVEELSIPSVGTLSRHGADCRRNAQWLVERFRKMGMEARLYEFGGGQPTVVAQWLGAPGKPTLTIYGHYDVQPADPLGEWVSPPFEPAIRDGSIYARGASDNKGQHLSSLKAAEYAFAAGGPPVNLRFLIEGEEEGGGEVLPDLLKNHAAELQTDYLFIHDGTLLQLLTGLRGNLYVEVEVTGAAIDLHSGAFGGLAPNPFNTLAHVLAELKDRDGRILIPGFYDSVREPEPEELESWSRLPITEEMILTMTGAPALEGEAGFSLFERNFVRPTLDVHGIMGGFTEEGTKTVIPAKATAKLSMRLVPDQDPDTIAELLERHLATLATPGTRVKLRRMGDGSWPVRLDVRHPGIAAASRAFEASFGRRPFLVRAGYSIPVVADFASALPAAHLFVSGFAAEEDGPHAPNERMVLDNFHRGTEMVIHLMDELAGV